MSDADGKRVLIDNVFLSILKLLVLIGVAIASVWLTDDLQSACICALTFLITVIFEAIKESLIIRQLDFSNRVIIVFWIYLVIVVAVIFLFILGLVFAVKDGFTFGYYKVVASIFLTVLAIGDVSFEILIAFRAND